MEEESLEEAAECYAAKQAVVDAVSSEEAELAVCLNMIPESPEAIAARTGLNAEVITPKLEEMSRKGLIFRRSKGDQHTYMAAQFVIGIWEYHLNDLDEELIRDVNAYLPHYFQKRFVTSETQQLRVIPVSQEIVSKEGLTRDDLGRQAFVERVWEFVGKTGGTILDQLKTRPTLDGTDEPLRVYLTCYLVLRANHDPRAREILDAAYRLLQERATHIDDEELRRSFLENVAAHREIARAWQEAAYRASEPVGATVTC